MVIGILLFVIIGFFLFKKISTHIINKDDSPAQLYKISGGNADVWWNKTKVTGPDTINPTTGEPFKIQHIRNITIKAIDVPLEVNVNKGITYSKLRIHPVINDIDTNAASKEALYKFPINRTTNYYTLETISHS